MRDTPLMLLNQNSVRLSIPWISCHRHSLNHFIPIPIEHQKKYQNDNITILAQYSSPIECKIHTGIPVLDNVVQKQPKTASDVVPQLIARQTLQQLQDLLGKAELAVLLGDLSMDEYSKITGISRCSSYRRLSRSRSIVEELLGSDSV